MTNPNITPSFFKTFALSFCLLLVLAFIGCSSKEDEVSTESEPCLPPEQVTQIPAAAPPIVNSEPPLPNIDAADENEPDKEDEKIAAPKPEIEEEPSISAIVSELSYSEASPERKIELLESLSMSAVNQDANVIPAISQAVWDPNAEVAMAAMELLQNFEGPVILPVISSVIQHDDANVRQYAIDLLADISDPQVESLLVDALEDESEDVRTAVLETAMLQNQDVQFAVATAGITSPHTDIKEASVTMLEARADKKAVDSLINGLQDENPEFRQTVSDIIESLIEQRFDTYEQANQWWWWSQNRDKFSDDLTPLGDEQG